METIIHNVESVEVIEKTYYDGASGEPWTCKTVIVWKGDLKYEVVCHMND